VGAVPQHEARPLQQPLHCFGRYGLHGPHLADADVVQLRLRLAAHARQSAHRQRSQVGAFDAGTNLTGSIGPHVVGGHLGRRLGGGLVGEADGEARLLVDVCLQLLRELKAAEVAVHAGEVQIELVTGGKFQQRHLLLHQGTKPHL